MPITKVSMVAKLHKFELLYLIASTKRFVLIFEFAVLKLNFCEKRTAFQHSTLALKGRDFQTKETKQHSMIQGECQRSYLMEYCVS